MFGAGADREHGPVRPSFGLGRLRPQTHGDSGQTCCWCEQPTMERQRSAREFMREQVSLGLVSNGGYRMQKAEFKAIRGCIVAHTLARGAVTGSPTGKTKSN